MSTINNFNLINQIIENDGKYEDDPILPLWTRENGKTIEYQALTSSQTKRA